MKMAGVLSQNIKDAHFNTLWKKEKLKYMDLVDPHVSWRYPFLMSALRPAP
jgi:hypothetical protein